LIKVLIRSSWSCDPFVYDFN